MTDFSGSMAGLVITATSKQFRVGGRGHKYNRQEILIQRGASSGERHKKHRFSESAAIKPRHPDMSKDNLMEITDYGNKAMRHCD
jgi:hypothetical protein